MDVTSADRPLRPTGVILLPVMATEEEWERRSREIQAEMAGAGTANAANQTGDDSE